MLDGELKVLPFSVADYRFGLPLETVNRVDAMVALTRVPDVPDPVIGVISVHGDVVPVVDIRRRLGLKQHPPRSTDHLVLVRDGEQEMALRVDAVDPVVAIAADAIAPPVAASAALPHIKGVGPTADGLLLIYDLAQCLAPEERAALSDILAGRDDDAPAG